MTDGGGGGAAALRRALDVVVCPVCAGELALDDRTLACAQGHSFDLARQGYVSLLTGRPGAGTGDSAAMVQARAELLAAGHFAPLADAVAGMAGEGVPAPRAVLDVGVGTGYYLAALLERHPEAIGVGLDTSKYALRRAARAHPRIAAAACDAWRTLPIRDASMDVVVNVFSPRNLGEFRRVLRPDGVLVVARPTEHHLAELRQAFDLVAVEAAKEARLERGLRDRFAPLAERHVEYTAEFSPVAACNAVLMGPSARHLDTDRLAALHRRERPVAAAVSVLVTAYRPL